MVRRLLLAGLVLVLGLPPLVAVLEHARGRRQLAAILQDLAARGETIELRKLVPPDVPMASNGLSAFTSAVGRLNGASGLLSPPLQLIAPGTAFPPQRLEGWSGHISGPVATAPTNTWSDAEAWVQSHAGDYEALLSSLALPHRRAHYDWQQGYQMLLPHLAKFKSAANTLALPASLAARRGDADETVQWLNRLHTLEDDLAQDPVLIGQLVRVACASIASSRFWQVTHLHDWTEPQLARLQEALPPSNLSETLVQSLEFERALVHYELHRLSPEALFGLSDASSSLFSAANPGTLNQVPQSLDEVGELAGSLLERVAASIRSQVLFPLWRYAWGDQAIAHYHGVMDDLLRVQREALRRSSIQPVLEFNLAERLAPRSLGDRLRGIYSRMLVPALERALTRALRQETERDLHRTAIALRRFQLRHQALPETLAELVPDFLPSVPLDRMDGKPLRYRREAADRFVLWSIGEDATDQDGDATWRSKQTTASPQWWLGADAVWPHPADEAALAQWQEAEEKKTARRKSESRGGTAPFGPGGMSQELMKRYGLLPRAGTNAPPTPPVAPAPATPAP